MSRLRLGDERLKLLTSTSPPPAAAATRAATFTSTPK